MHNHDNLAQARAYRLVDIRPQLREKALQPNTAIGLHSRV
jgi:hypothetical protein